MVAKFIIQCFLIYLVILLAGLSLNFKPAYTNFIIGNSNLFLSKISNKATMDVWRVGFLPLALIIALFGATKFQTTLRKIIYSIVGILSVHLVTLLSFKLKSIYFYNLFVKEVEKTELLKSVGTIDFVNNVFLNNIVFVLAIPVLFWFALTYKSNYFLHFHKG